MRLPDIKRKLFNRNAVAKDRSNNSVAPGDMVILEDTRLRGRSGTVKYIHMGAIFLHARCGPDPQRTLVRVLSGVYENIVLARAVWPCHDKIQSAGDWLVVPEKACVLTRRLLSMAATCAGM